MKCLKFPDKDCDLLTCNSKGKCLWHDDVNSNTSKHILIIGSGVEGMNALLMHEIKEKYGNDVVLITPEQAQEKGLKPEAFANIPQHKIIAPPIMEVIGEVPLSGKQNRSKRRAAERKSKKKFK